MREKPPLLPGMEGYLGANLTEGKDQSEQTESTQVELPEGYATKDQLEAAIQAYRDGKSEKEIGELVAVRDYNQPSKFLFGRWERTPEEVKKISGADILVGDLPEEEQLFYQKMLVKDFVPEVKAASKKSESKDLELSKYSRDTEVEDEDDEQSGYSRKRGTYW